MIPAEAVPVILSVVLGGGLYLYILGERRKVIAARERRRQHPAE